MVLCTQDVFPQIEGLISPDGRVPGLSRALVSAYSEYLGPSSTVGVPEFVRAPLVPNPACYVTPWQDALASGHTPGPLLVGPQDWCVMPYTSGTTGKPKGCVHTHASVMHTALAAALWGRATAADVMLGVVPLFHVTGMQACMNLVIYVGATVVLMPRWDRVTAAALIERYRVTSWTNVPTMVVDLLALPDLAHYDLTSLRRVSGGGTAMPAAVAQKMRDLWGMDYIEGYGLSETIAASHSNPSERPKKQCLGVPIFDIESHIIDPETLSELAPGEVGEIITAGPQVFQGYWKDSEKTAAAFIEFNGHRFFRTGDLARMDQDGYYFMVDRVKRMINASGFKVWPAEVESMLYRHPAIQEACVIAAHDEYRGETVKAIIVLHMKFRTTITAADLIVWAHDIMAAYKVPRVIEFVDSIPKSETGKIMWRFLQEQEAAKNARKVTV